MRDDRIRAGGAQIVGGKSFKNFMRQPVRGGQREFQRVGIGDAGAVEIGRLEIAFLGERFDLRRGAVHEHHANVQRAQHRDIQQDVAEIFIGDDGAVHLNDERFLPELRDVLQDAAQVSQFHFKFSLSVK